jgi:hypothetical protein
VPSAKAWSRHAIRRTSHVLFPVQVAFPNLGIPVPQRPGGQPLQRHHTFPTSIVIVASRFWIVSDPVNPRIQ